jgi:hypothetical protein
VNESSAPAHLPAEQGHPHACLDGYVYIGYAVESPTTSTARSSSTRLFPAAGVLRSAPDGWPHYPRHPDIADRILPTSQPAFQPGRSPRAARLYS